MELVLFSSKNEQALDIVYVRSTSEEEFVELDHNEFPPHFLQSLYLKGRLERLPMWISDPDSVAKIGLKWSKLEANEDPLEALQALMELDLVQNHTGAELEFKATAIHQPNSRDKMQWYGCSNSNSGHTSMNLPS